MSTNESSSTRGSGDADDSEFTAPIDVAPEKVRAAANLMRTGTVTVPRRSYGLIIAGTVGIILLSLVMVYVIVYLIRGLGVDAFATGGILALIPLTIVLFGIRWVDRWEPEPRGAIAFAFLWGAGMAILIALLVDAGVSNAVSSVGSENPASQFFGAVIQAPIVEETGKGLGILLLFLFARKLFDGPIDGLVYGATIAGGFAFTENILYFGQALTDSEATRGVFELFLIRGLLSPFTHVMFTACTGMLLGLASRRPGTLGGIGFFVLGLVPAILLHALWNGSLYFVQDFYGYYAVVQVPLFILMITLVLALRRQEARLTQERLAEYAAAGWFGIDEVPALATTYGRRVAMAWANRRGLGKVMKRYTQDATRLAFNRQRMMTGRGGAAARAEEARLLSAILKSRRALHGTLDS